MTYTLKRRAVVPPRDPANRQSVEQLKFAVDELSGAVGRTYDRAVRVGELVEAGLLHIQVDGTLGIGGTARLWNEISFETTGVYFRTPQHQLDATGSAFVRQPRIFVQPTDPGAAASDGDIWVWTGFVRYRSAGAWVTAAP